ncbi:MAG: phosphatase PAP2 family protein [Candidatus Dormibacteraceae bacterium]
MRRQLVAMVALAIGFVALSAVVGAGVLHPLDHAVDRLGQHLWSPGVEPIYQFIALFGGIEVTSGLALWLFIWLRRQGFRAESWALLAYPAALLLETMYKRVIYQAGPLPGHEDGPSLSALLVKDLPNSFPSGHQVRTVVVYGLLAFCLHRLLPPGRVRSAAYPVLGLIIGLMAMDRIIVEAHWASDVVGGLLLGGAVLAAAVAWMELPRSTN